MAAMFFLAYMYHAASPPTTTTTTNFQGPYNQEGGLSFSAD